MFLMFELSAEEVPCPGIGWVWKDRSGGENTVWFSVPERCDWDAEKARTRELAMQAGYPGHAGGLWNYLVSDFHEWLARQGWTRCKCHPR